MKRAKKRRIWVFFLIALITVALDYLSKLWAKSELVDGSIIHTNVFNDFITMKLVYNSGASFSFLQNSTLLITIVACVMTLLLLIFDIAFVNRVMLHIGLGMIAGGSIGNLIDRFVTPGAIGEGKVLDFIQYSTFFTGNVADIFIVLGALLAMIGVFKSTYSGIKPKGANPRHMAE
ncbi:MAG: signal peptidase II [Bifidobacteriaceae bacterium]|jgi:signal peptidase II|nr:signal peptidase II [Bifidobacteriaceae bacterium]